MTGVGLRLLEGSLVSELQARQAELNRALADTGSDEDRARLMAQLDEVTNQLKELVAKRRQARSAPAGGWRTSARFLADVRAGRKGKLAKRKELSRQRAAKHRLAREGRANACLWTRSGSSASTNRCTTTMGNAKATHLSRLGIGKPDRLAGRPRKA